MRPISTPAEKQDLLETFDVQERLDKLLRIWGAIHRSLAPFQADRRDRELLKAGTPSTSCASSFARFQKELGEGEGAGTEIAELREAIEKAKMPEEAEKQALKELARLERTPEASAEHSMIRSYLDWLIELPWSKLSEERIDIAEAARILDEDHYGLRKVKERILELAVRKLEGDRQEPDSVLRRPAWRGQDLAWASQSRARWVASSCGCPRRTA